MMDKAQAAREALRWGLVQKREGNQGRPANSCQAHPHKITLLSCFN